MINKFKETLSSKLVKSAGIYTVTSVINSAIPFLLLPILTRYLSPEDYGVVSMFGVLISFTTPFIGLNIHGAIARMYYEKKEIDIKAYITNSFYILLASTLFVSILFYVFSSEIEGISSLPSDLFWIVILVSVTQFIVKVVLVLWQVQVRPIQYGIYQILFTVLNLGLSLVFIVALKYTWQGRIYAQAVSGAIFAIFGFYVLYKNKWLKFTFNIGYIMNALRFGVPLIPHALGGILISMTDRIFITNMVGIETTGIYTVGYQIGMIINILAISFNQAYTPWLYEKLKECNEKINMKIVKFTYMFFIAILSLAILLSISSPLLLKIFVGKEFLGSSVYVLWIAIGYAFNGMYFMVGNYILYEKKTMHLSLVTFLTAMLNIILNYYLIKKYGAVGAALATTAVYFIRFVMTWKLSAILYKMPWSLKTSS